MNDSTEHLPEGMRNFLRNLDNLVKKAKAGERSFFEETKMVASSKTGGNALLKYTVLASAVAVVGWLSADQLRKHGPWAKRVVESANQSSISL